MKKTNIKDKMKQDKSLLVCKILTSVSICLSLVAMLFGCASMSAKTNNEQTNIQTTTQNNLIVPNFDNELSDILGAFMTNNDSRSQINVGKIFEDAYNNEKIYLGPLFDNLSRYLQVDRRYNLGGYMRLVKYFTSDFSRVERAYYITSVTLTMNEEYDLYSADFEIMEEGGSALIGHWYIPSWNYEASYIEIGPIRWDYPFTLYNFEWNISYANMSYAVLPFYAWALSYSGIDYYVSLSRNFNYNLLLQSPTLEVLYSFSRTPFINEVDYGLPNDYFNTDGGYFDTYIGNFSSNGYVFDTIRAYYKNAENANFYTPDSDYINSNIITGTANDYYVSSISYYHSKTDFELSAFTRAKELSYDSGTDVNYKVVFGMNLEASYLGSYDLTLYARNGFTDLQQRKFILTFLNFLSEGNAIAGGTIAGGNVFDDFFQLIYDMFASITPLLSISIFGTFTLGTFVFIPFVLSFIMIIIKLFKR